MDINKMLAELREEREQIEEAIVTLERLAGARGHRRGRPPAWLKKGTDPRLNIAHPQPPHRVEDTGERARPDGPPRSRDQSPEPVGVGAHTTES